MQQRIGKHACCGFMSPNAYQIRRSNRLHCNCVQFCCCLQWILAVILFCFVLICLFFFLLFVYSLSLSLHSSCKFVSILSFRFSLQITCSPLIHTQHTNLLLFCVLALYLSCHPVWKINQSHALCI